MTVTPVGPLSADDKALDKVIKLLDLREAEGVLIHHLDIDGSPAMKKSQSRSATIWLVCSCIDASRKKIYAGKAMSATGDFLRGRTRRRRN